VLFGSEGIAQVDFERIEEINAEIGLTQILRGDSEGLVTGTTSDAEKTKVAESPDRV
jgi:hypothetical protein